MYHVSAQGIDEHMINVHYYYYQDGAVLLKVLYKQSGQISAVELNWLHHL